MHKFNQIGISLIVLFLSSNALFGQFYAAYQNDLPVFRNGNQLTSPWAGGINSGQFSTIDANLDGMDDVFVFDRAGQKVMVFLNNGSNDPNSFEYSFVHSQLFPELRNWVLLRDFDCDGRKDIFTFNGFGGIRIYRNVSTMVSGLQFTEREDNLQQFLDFGNNSYYTNVGVTSVDIPAIDDFDGDGDLDIMTYSTLGIMMEYTRNFSVEITGGCDSLAFELKNRCYGYFSESAFDNTITLHDETFHNQICLPGYNIANPSPEFERPEAPEFNGGARHAGTTILTLDLNQQLPKEIVLGDIGANNLTALINSSTTSGMDSVIAANTSFPFGYGPADSVNMDLFPGAFYEDLNNDGVRDLIVSPNEPNAAINHESVWYFQNTGLDDLPVFSPAQFDLFQREMIETGEGANPVFFDYNQDGLPDLLVANRGYYIEAGNWSSKIALFENTGTADDPAFTFMTDDFMNLSSFSLGQGLYPTFGDMDGDGDPDMLIGTSSGELFVFNNTAGTGNPVQFELAVDPVLKDIDGTTIDPGQFATPQLFDIDQDGLIDLLMGERNGQIHFYRNTGSEANAEFEFVTGFLGEVNTSEGFPVTGYSIIQFFEWDGEIYLLTGGEPGKIRLYQNISGNLDEAFELVNGQLFGVKNGIRSSVAALDINNDGYLDFFFGNHSGGILFFEGAEPTGFGKDFATDPAFIVYPNPASSAFFVKTKDPLQSRIENLIVYDTMGRIQAQLNNFDTSQPVETSGWSPGIYIIKVQSDDKWLGSRQLVLH